MHYTLFKLVHPTAQHVKAHFFSEENRPENHRYETKKQQKYTGELSFGK